MMKKKKFALVLTLLAGVLLAACQPTPPVETPPAEDEFVYGQDATVESLTVNLLESFPLQAQAFVKGYLPDGCTELHEVIVTRQGNEFTILLTTRRPSGDVACTMALVPFEERVDLEVSDLPAGTYSVIAQDQRAQFTLDVENVLPVEPIGGREEVVLTSDAVLEDLSAVVMESYPVQVNAILTGYFPDGCSEIQDIHAVRDGDTFTIDIVTKRPGGDVACIMMIVPFEEVLALEVYGLPAGEYIVRSGNLHTSFTLEVDN